MLDLVHTIRNSQKSDNEEKREQTKEQGEWIRLVSTPIVLRQIRLPCLRLWTIHGGIKTSGAYSLPFPTGPSISSTACSCFLYFLSFFKSRYVLHHLQRKSSRILTLFIQLIP